MNQILLHSILTIVSIIMVPPLLLGLVRKTKARLQNRRGAPVWQPLLDLIKMIRKDETVSDTASWVFRFSAAASAAASVFLAVTAPWIAPKLNIGSCDLFLFVYIFAAIRLFTLLAAMDTASAFGAFAASREATLSFLIEPAAVLSLVALAIGAKSSDLNVIFSNAAGGHGVLWILAGTALLLASLVELSRMPIDDPTTHLELTMVHEAMILEASGKNLTLFEFANMVKLSVLFGLSAQCFLHALPNVFFQNNVVIGLASLSMLAALGICLGVFESLAVKLNWRKAPEFIAYALTLSFMASIVALGVTAL